LRLEPAVSARSALRLACRLQALSQYWTLAHTVAVLRLQAMGLPHQAQGFSATLGLWPAMGLYLPGNAPRVQQKGRPLRAPPHL